MKKLLVDIIFAKNVTKVSRTFLQRNCAVIQLHNNEINVSKPISAFKLFSHFCLLLFFFTGFGVVAKAQSTSIYDAYIITNTNGGGNIYTDLTPTSFNGSNLGTFLSGTNTLVVKGGQNKTSKCSGGNVTGGNFNYRVYLTSGTGGSFTSIGMGFISNDGSTSGCGSGNQTWEATSGATNIIAGLSPGTYYLEVYTDAPGSPSTAFYSNFGSNYKATFTVTGPPPPNYMVHQGSVTAVANACSGSSNYWNITPVSCSSLILEWNVELNGQYTNTGIYYTTDGTTPSGGRGVGMGTTTFVAGSLVCTDGSNRQILTGTIPAAANTFGTTVKYIIGAWNSSIGTEGFATTSYVYQNTTANVYSYTCSSMWVGGTSSDWNTASNWGCSTVPVAGTNVIIPSSAIHQPVIGLTAGNAVCNNLTILSGASLTMQSSNNLTISSGGIFSNSGTFTATSSTGILIFAGTATVAGSSSTTFNNITINGATTFSVSPTINGTLQLNAGASVLTNSPSYACSSTLKYNNLGNTAGTAQSRGLEWTTATTGAGFPGNVYISGTSFINGNNNGNNNVATCGDLTIDINSGLFMDYGSAGNATLTVGGNTLVNGNLSLGEGVGGDLYMKGNFTVGASGVMNYVPNTPFPTLGRALQFIGTATQVITLTGGGTLTIPIIDVNKTSGNLQLSTGTNILIPDYGTTNNSLKLENTGNLDLNGQTLTISGNTNGGHYIGILAKGGVRTITGIAGSTLAITATSFAAGTASVSVDTTAGGSLVTDVNVLVTTNVGFAPTASTTVNGTLQLNQLGVASVNNGFLADTSYYLNPTVSKGHCIYGPSSTLIYSDGGAFSRNIEWDAVGIGTIGFTPGFPNNVIINNSTYVNIGDSTATSGIADRAIAGSLTIQSGDSLKMGTMDHGAHHLYITKDVNINGTLLLASGTTSTIPTSGDVYVGGNWTRAIGGVFNYNAANPRAVTFNNATSGTITAPASTGETFAYAYLSKTSTSAKITLADSVSIVNQLGLNEGILDLSNSNMTILSRNSNTANIGITTTPANISLPYSGTGRFVIERYFPARRSWRLVTAPITSTNAPTISQAWQEGAVNTSNTSGGIVDPVPGYGTEITGPYSGTSGASFGFDPGTQPHSSIYYYTAGSWVIPSSTNGVTITSNLGYLLFVRGTRNYVIGNEYTTPTTDILNPKGEINVGDQTISASGAGFKVIGNPYASSFNFLTTLQSGMAGYDASHADIYEWDPQLNSGTTSTTVGAFVTLHWNGTNYSAAPTPLSPIDLTNGRIESGAAFLVKFTGAGSLTIHESDKVSANALVFRPENSSPLISLRANLYARNPDSTFSLNDGVLNLFDPSYNNDVDAADAVKFTTLGENISLKRQGQLLAIESRRTAVPNDSIFYNLSQLSVKNYRLQLIGVNLSTTGLEAHLEDTLLHTSTLINLDDTSNINFNIPDAATAANSSGRFILVFKQSSPLPGSVVPVTYSNIKAWQKNINSSNIMVEWGVENELNIKQYEVEKSADGKNFSIINATAPIGNMHSTETYIFMDLDGKRGDNFYRIKSTGSNGLTEYSTIAKVNIGGIQSGISIYPNPVLNGVIGIQLNNQPQGKYNFRVINASGQVMAVAELVHNGGNTTEPININNYLTGEAYTLEIVKPDNSKTLILFIAGKK